MDIEERPHDYVCFDCGKQFLSAKQLKESNVVTCHLGDCALCGEVKSITHIRAFNWLRRWT